MKQKKWTLVDSNYRYWHVRADTPVEAKEKLRLRLGKGTSFLIFRGFKKDKDEFPNDVEEVLD